MFLKAILSMKTTPCRRPSADLLPSVGEALNTATLLFGPNTLLCHMGVLGCCVSAAPSTARYGAPKVSVVRYRISACEPPALRCTSLPALLLVVAACCGRKHGSCMLRRAQRACPARRTPHALVRASGRLASPRFASCSPVGKEVASERLRRQRGASKVRTCAHARTAWPTQSLEGCSSCARCRCRSGPRWTSADRCVRA